MNFSSSATDVAYCLVGELGADVEVDKAQSSAVLMVEGSEKDRLGFCDRGMVNSPRVSSASSSSDMRRVVFRRRRFDGENVAKLMRDGRAEREGRLNGCLGKKGLSIEYDLRIG